MIGHEDDYLGLLERAHRAHLAAGRELAALRCAFWVGVTLARRGEMGRAGGWLGRAQRLLDRQEGDCVERGYLLVPAIFEQEAGGDLEGAAATAGEAAAIAERFGDSDLFALAAHERGHILIQNGRLKDGLGLLDEAMVAVTAGELSPIVSGIVYCGVILACQDAHEVRRAQEWTAALTRWCERQPDLVAFTGRCLVHRAEILQLQGAWAEALEEARRAGERCRQAENDGGGRRGVLPAGGDPPPARRLRRGGGGLPGGEPPWARAAAGPRPAATGAGQDRRRRGRDPQGDGRDAPSRQARAGCCPPASRSCWPSATSTRPGEACRELEPIAEGHEGGALGAMAAQARGAVELADGDAPGSAASRCVAPARCGSELEAPYEAARARVLVALACRGLGDEDTAALELEAARAAFAELGAAPDLARVDALAKSRARGDPHGLTDRELEVLRLLSAGATNKAIAAELVLSVRTVDRHVSNIFAKLGVSSRAAATAYAHEHGLV